MQCCPCHELPMSCPMSHVSTMGPGQETSADVFRLGSNTGSVSHQDPGQPPHPALSCLQRRGSLQDCLSLLILSQLQRHKAGPAPPLPFQVFTGHRKGKGDALWLCSQVSDWLKVPSEASDWLIMTPCLLWAPNMGLANYLHYLTLHPA